MNTNTNQNACGPFMVPQFRDALSALSQFAPSLLPRGEWGPPLDLWEAPDAWTINIGIPGVRREDFDISWSDGVITISGKRHVEDQANAQCVRRELASGEFKRSIALPDTVDSNGISANYKDGVLSIRVPKAESAKPRKIEVGSS